MVGWYVHLSTSSLISASEGERMALNGEKIDVLKWIVRSFNAFCTWSSDVHFPAVVGAEAAHEKAVWLNNKGLMTPVFQTVAQPSGHCVYKVLANCQK